MTVLAATRWPTNAEMIEDVVRLGYILPDDSVLDVTFGQGIWWKNYHHPGKFVGCVRDQKALYDACDGPILPEGHVLGCAFLGPGDGHVVPFDFRNLNPVNAAYGPFTVGAFDPPYVAMGGRETSGLGDFMDGYGLRDAPRTPAELQAHNDAGLAELARILQPGGIILAKCAPYISSGVRQDGDWWARDAGLALGLKIEDMLIHVGDVRPQPPTDKCKACKGEGGIVESDGDYEGAGAHTVPCEKCDGVGHTPRRQVHARNNYSVLFVFRKPGRRPRRKVTK